MIIVNNWWRPIAERLDLQNWLNKLKSFTAFLSERAANINNLFICWFGRCWLYTLSNWSLEGSAPNFLNWFKSGIQFHSGNVSSQRSKFYSSAGFGWGLLLVSSVCDVIQSLKGLVGLPKFPTCWRFLPGICQLIQNQRWNYSSTDFWGRLSFIINSWHRPIRTGLSPQIPNRWRVVIFGL